MTKRDGICNIRNFGLEIVCTNPHTEKQKKFEALFLKINDRYWDSCRYDYPTDSFLQELKAQFDNGNACHWLMFDKRKSFFSSVWHDLRHRQQENDWKEFVDTLIRYGFGIDLRPFPSMSAIAFE